MPNGPKSNSGRSGHIAIVVHGGAGPPPRGVERSARIRAATDAAVAAGYSVLSAGGSSVDAVEAAVVLLEEEPELNAGRGAALTETGQPELDAAIMDGAGRRMGAVAAARRIRNPVLAARALLEEGRHALIVGEAATRYGEAAGLELRPEEWFIVDMQRAALREAVTPAAKGTVGAVARDRQGHLAAATSTGGIAGQRCGRVGDSPLVGAGTWADDRTVAVSCTGDGEAIIRVALAHEVDALVRHAGLSLADACESALAMLTAVGGEGGLIAVGSGGEAVTRFSSPALIRGWRVDDGPLQVVVDTGNLSPA